MEQPEFKNELELKYNQIDVYLTTNQTEVHIKENGQYELPEKKLFWIFRRPNRGTYVAKIEVNEEVNKKLELRKNPFSCSFKNTQEYSEKCKFTLNGEKNVNFSIKFDPSSITNCKETKLTEDLVFDLPFKLSIIKIEKRKDGNEYEVEVCDEKEDHIQVVLKEFTPKPIVTFTPNEEVVTDGKIKYQEIEDKNEVKIGTVTIEHNANFSAAPKLNTYIILSSDDGHIGYIFIIKEQDTQYLIGNGSTVKLNSLSLDPTEKKVYDVYWSPNDIWNPEEDKMITFKAEFGDHKKNIGSITILRDKTLTEAAVELTGPWNTKKSLYNRECRNVTLNIPNIYTLDSAANFGDNIFGITFKNLATNGAKGEYVQISKVNIEPNWDLDNAQRLVFINSVEQYEGLTWSSDRITEQKISVNRLKKFVTLKIGNLTIIPKDEETSADETTPGNDKNKSVVSFKDIPIPQEGKLAGQKECDRTFNIMIKFNKDILYATYPNPEDNTTHIDVCFKLSYDIVIYRMSNGRPDPSGQSHRTATFTIRMRKKPEKELYCIDFGTSAITAISSKITSGANDIELTAVDLSKSRNEFYNKNTTNTNNELDDEPAPFINSRLFFNNRRIKLDTAKPKDLGTDEYMQYPIWLSPVRNTYDPNYEIPNLKSIIGHESIPISLKLDNIKRYCYINEEGEQIPLIKNNQYSEIFDTKKIFSLCYQQLFKHFIHTNNQINQIVITVPNTYTPQNIQDIKYIVRKAIPSIYPESLHVVSESDAVAYYYLNDEGENQSCENSNDSKSILIYDMGAGTLDLTLLKKEFKDGVTTIDIERKMGVSMAGNFLDFVIFEIIVDYIKNNEQYKNKYKEQINKLRQIIEDLSLSDAKKHDYNQALHRNEIKSQIKNIKAEIEKGGYLKFEYDFVIFYIKSDYVTGHEKFKKFLNDVTSGVFNHLLEGIEQINVVVFSGRSTALKKITEKVENDLQNRYPEGDIKYMSIFDKETKLKPDEDVPTSTKSDNEPNQETNEELNITTDNEQSKGTDNKTSTSIEFLKKVVASGACIYVHRFYHHNRFKQITRANYAAFGVIIVPMTGKSYEYMELIPKGQKYSENGRVTGEANITMENIRSLVLVQTYSTQTKEDYIQNSLGLISRLTEIKNENNQFGDKITLSLTLYDQTNPQNEGQNVLQLIINGGAGDYAPYENLNQDRIKKSLWPVLFDVKQ